MTENRRKEIALLLIEARITERGFPGVEQIRRDIGNEAKKIGVAKEELLDFYLSFFPNLLKQVFGIDTMVGKLR